LKIGRHFNAVSLVVFHFGNEALAILHNYMARRAGTTAAAGVFDVEAEMHGHIEKRLGFAVLAVGQCIEVEIKGIPGGKERHFRHEASIT